MANFSESLLIAHRIIGYPTAFVIAPLALLAYAGANTHRKLGKAYFYLMTVLYLSGTWFTFTHHNLASWEFARNLTFNFFGYSMVLYAYRAIRLFTTPGVVVPDRADRALAYLLTFSVAAIFSVAIWKNTPMRVFTLLGIWLCSIEWRELNFAEWKKPLLYRRHMRYILASYFYVLTVVSVVHLNDELPKNIKWLWPAFIYVAVIALLTSENSNVWFEKVGKRVTKAALTKAVVWSVFSLSMLFGGYVVYDLVYGSSLQGGQQ